MIQSLNDSACKSVLALNAASALASAAFGVVALVSPGALPGIDGGARVFAAMYAVRALPIAAALLGLVVLAWRHEQRGLLPMLLVAGVSQLGDATIGIAAGIGSMAAGAGFATVVHLGSAWLLRTISRRRVIAHSL